MHWFAFVYQINNKVNQRENVLVCEIFLETFYGEKNNWFFSEFFIFSMKVLLKLSSNGSLTNSLKAPINKTPLIKVGFKCAPISLVSKHTTEIQAYRTDLV